MSDMEQHPSVDPSPKKRKLTRTDWFEIGQKYIHDKLEGPAFCERENLDYDQFHEHQTRKHWNEERGRLLARVAANEDEEFVLRKKVVAAEIDQEAESVVQMYMARLYVAGETERDLTKLKNGVVGIERAYKLLREAHGLPKVKPEPAENGDSSSGVPKAFFFLDDSGTPVFIDPVTGKNVPPTSDAVPLG